MFENRYVRRYPHNCWVLERWISPRNYGSPELWASTTANSEGFLSIGPYPMKGVYEAVSMFAAPDHSYIPLLPDLVLLTLQAIWAGRIRRTWDIRNGLLEQEKARELMSDAEFEATWDATHGVRRGVSFSKDGVVQNNAAERQAYIEKLVASGVQLQRDEFRPGFRQGEL